jgi:hypothetical protein
VGSGAIRTPTGTPIPTAEGIKIKLDALHA